MYLKLLVKCYYPKMGWDHVKEGRYTKSHENLGMETSTQKLFALQAWTLKVSG